MRNQFPSQFLTLVLLGLFALFSPHASAEVHKEAPNPKAVKETDEPPVKLEDADVTVTPVQAPPKNMQLATQEYYYPYIEGFTLRFGASAPLGGDDTTIQSVVGFNYLLPKFQSPKWEFGFDITNKSEGRVAGGLRWIVNEHGTFRPYYKAGAMIALNPEQKFSSIVDYKNYAVSGSGGFEWLLIPPISFRLDAELNIGFSKSSFVVTVGGVWGW